MNRQVREWDMPLALNLCKGLGKRSKLNSEIVFLTYALAKVQRAEMTVLAEGGEQAPTYFACGM